MSKIKINSCDAANESGDVLNIVKKKPIEGNKNSNGYIMCSVRKHAQKGQKSYYDNRLCNLQQRDYTFAAKNHQNKKCVKAINCETKEVSYYNSMYAVQQHLGINAGIVKMVCEKINRCKTGISKIDNHSYKFEYVNKQDMPDDYKKSANIRPNKVPIEERKKHITEAIKRWQQKEYKCPKCGKTFKNSYKFVHNKICKTIY